MQQMERGPEDHQDQYHCVEIAFVFHKHMGFFPLRPFKPINTHHLHCTLSRHLCIEQLQRT